MQKLYDRVRTTLNLPLEDDVTYSAEEVMHHVNTAFGFIEVSEEIYIQLEAGVRRYVLPDSWLETETVALEGTLPALQPFNPRTMVQSGIHNQSGRPTHYAEEGEYVDLWPVPTTSTTLAVYGRMNPPEVETLEDPIHLVKGYRDALVFYVVGMCLSRETDPQSSYYLELWNSFLAKQTRSDVRKRNRQHMQPSKGLTSMHYHRVRR